MNEKQKRLNEVYNHLRNYYGIHTQGDFADAIRYSRPVISSALNGNEDALTDKLFKNICAAYKGTFNIEYLLHGEGELLTIEEQVKIGDIEMRYANKPTEMPEYMQKAFDMNARLAQQNEMLCRQLSNAVADNKELKEQLKSALVSVEGMKGQLAMVLQMFHPHRSVPQFHENFVSEGLEVK